jgi:hypothetical protein
MAAEYDHTDAFRGARFTEAELDRVVTRSPAPGYPDQERTVAGCLRVVLDEECEHYRHAMRDLAVLEARLPKQTQMMGG